MLCHDCEWSHIADKNLRPSVQLAEIKVLFLQPAEVYESNRVIGRRNRRENFYKTCPNFIHTKRDIKFSYNNRQINVYGIRTQYFIFGHMK